MVSKSKRRRQAKARANAGRANFATGSVAAGSAGGRRQKNVSDFARCALNPFAGVGMSNGVPDRFDGNVVVIENETITNFKFESDSDVIFLVLPAFGKNLYSAGLNQDGSMKFEKSVSYNAVVDAEEAYKFSAFRTISLGAKITYVGKPLDASGVLFATQFKMRYGGAIDLVVKDADKSEDDFEFAGVEPQAQAVRSVDPFSVSMTDIMSSPDSSMLRLSSGAVLVAKHSSGDSWNFSEIWEDDCYMTDLNIDSSKDAIKFTNVLGGKDGKLFKGYDDSSYGILFRVTGHQSSGRIIVETKHCLEAIPSLNTGVYRTLARPSAKRDPAAIDLVVDVQRNLPVAVEGGVASWGSAISKALSGVDVSSIVRKMGAMALGPGVSAIERLLF